MNTAVLCETAMIICFGLSWPAAIMKSLTSRTAKGKSLLFMCLIEVGYICGIVGKLISHTVNIALIFYFINFAMVFVDICLYFRNRKLDLARETSASQE